MMDVTRLALALRKRHRDAVSSEEADDCGAPIGLSETGSTVTFSCPSLERSSSALVLGASGCGKTALLTLIAVWEIISLSALGYCAWIVEPKGDLVAYLLAALCLWCPDRLASDVIYLEPFKLGFPFNLRLLRRSAALPLDVRARQIGELVAEQSVAVGVLKHLTVGARQLDVIGALILAALACEHPGANVLWALEALLIKDGLKRLAGLTTSERAKQFLLSAHLSDELVASCSARLRSAFALTEGLERLVSAPACLQWDEILLPGKIVIMDLSEPPIPSQTPFYASLFASLGIDELMLRPSPYRGGHVRIFLDEAAVVASALESRAESVLQRGRSKNVSLIAGSQGTVVIEKASDSLLDILLTNAPVICGRLNAPDAELLARSQAPRAGSDETLSAIRGRFIGQVVNLPNRQFFQLLPGERRRFTSAPLDFSAMERASVQYVHLVKTAKERFALPSTARPVPLADAAPKETRAPRGRDPGTTGRATTGAGGPRSRWG